jgi:transposase
MSFPSAKSIDHLGLVAGFSKEIGIAEIINDAIGDTGLRKVSTGDLFVAMLLNGLGFTGRTLHMYSEYFTNRPLDRLLGEGIAPEHINDDALGRCLDALYDYGVSDLYQQLGEKVVSHLGLANESLHLDSSSFHYDGQETPDDDMYTVRLTKGYSRDHRPELNQVILNLICENQSGIPVYMKPASGNSNDMEGFKQIVKAHIGSLKAAQSNRYLVADAALYTQETLVDLHNMGQTFITRVPQTLKEAKALIKSASTLSFEPISEGYEGVWCQSDYACVAQHWLLVRSEQAQKRERHTLDKRMLKQAEQSRKSFKKLCQLEFACEDDANQALAQWRAKQTVCDVDASIRQVPVYTGAGRPAKDQVPTRHYYAITGALLVHLATRQAMLKELGLFIIATNQTDNTLTMDKMLSTYKSQQAVEKGFRFLKSPDFLTSSFYLKKPERIEALLMVMTTCLMVYSALEHKIRAELVAQDKTFPNMKYKPYQNPTARWVFQCFEGIILIYQSDNTQIMVNMQERNHTIVNCLGYHYQQIYS